MRWFDASGHDLDTSGSQGARVLREKCISGDDLVRRTHHRSKTPLTPWTVESPHGKRIPQKDRIIEIEDQAAGSPAKQGKLPPLQKFTLNDDGVGIPKFARQTEPAPPRPRERTEL
jgi:hypothetical protein